MPTFRRSQRTFALIAALGLLFLAMGTWAILTNSGTSDEVGAHLPSGILAWKSGSFSGGVANPPLGQLLVASLPVLAGVANHPLEDRPAMLALARAPVLVLGLLMIAVIALFAARIGGPRSAIAAAIASVFCPNLLAHSSLATLDLPSAAFGALACFLAWNFSRAPSVPRAIPFALAVAVAVEIKFTALHLLPALTIAMFLCARATASPRSPARAGALAGMRSAALLLSAAILGIVLVHVLLSLAFPAREGSSLWNLASLQEKWSKGRGGHFSYLLGNWSATGFPQYFLVALLVKLPLATILLFFAGVVRLLRARSLAGRRDFLAFVVLPGLWILLAMTFVHRVHIGIRHVLPAFPAILAIAGLGWAGLWEKRGVARIAAILLGVWLVVSTASVLPDPLAYFNEIAGGPRGGERFLIDSNLDWGQDERRIRRYIQGHTLYVNPPRPVQGLIAINVDAIHGLLTRRDQLDWAAMLDPVERIGHTWRIVSANDSTVSQAGQRGPREALGWAQWLIQQGHDEEARALLARHDLSRHPKLSIPWREQMAEVELALGDPAAALRFLNAETDLDLTIETMFRISEKNATPWVERPAQERHQIYRSLIARGKSPNAESLALRVLATSPQDPDALRALLVSRLSLRAVVMPVGGPVLNPGDVPQGRPFDLFTSSPSSLTPADRLVRIAFLMEARVERHALEEAGALLADDPANSEAMNLYGELVVRRKLGASQYVWPKVDWSNVKRRG